MSIETPASTRARPLTPPLTSGDNTTAFAGIRVEILICIALFIIAIIPRAAWIAYNDRPPKGLNDPALYALFSDLIADGRGYVRPPADVPGAYTGPDDPNLRSAGNETAYYPAGYPLSLGALKKGGRHLRLGPQHLLAQDDERRVRRDYRRAAVPAGLAAFSTGVPRWQRAVCSPSSRARSSTPARSCRSRSLRSSGSASLLVLLWRPWTREGMPWQQLFAAGVLLSFATMTRGITLMFPGLLLAVWLFTCESKKRALIQAAVVWAGIAVLIVPWSIRNTLAFGQLTGPSTNVGDDLCIGNYLGAQGAFVLSGKCFEGYEGQSPQQVELARNKEGVRIAIKDVASHPFRMPKLIAQKAYWLLYKDDDGIWAAESYGNDYFIPNFRREVLAFAANSDLLRDRRARDRSVALAFVLAKDIRRLVVMLALLYVLAIPLVFFGDPRFHFPGDPARVRDRRCDGRHALGSTWRGARPRDGASSMCRADTRRGGAHQDAALAARDLRAGAAGADAGCRVRASKPARRAIRR